MAKDKPNLTVVPVLNKQLKPKPDYLGQDAYQLYVRVFIGSKHTHIPVSIADPYSLINFYVTEQEFKLIEEAYFSAKELSAQAEPNALTHTIQEIEERIIRLWHFHDEKRLPELQLKGLSKKLRYLYTPLIGIIAENVFNLVRSWLIENTQISNLIINEIIFSRDKSFEEAFEGIIGMYCNSVIVFPPEVLHDIEFAFLFKAYSSERKLLADVHDVLILNAEDEFGGYLEEHEERLFGKDNELRLPLRNKYSRFVSLFPPTTTKTFYTNKINITKEKIYFEYKEKYT